MTQERRHYFLMSLLIAGVVVFGFSRTVDEGLIHPAYPLPWIIYLHAAVFSAWIVLLVTQSGLVRIKHVTLHRKLGMWGLALGIALPIVGMATKITMTRFEIAHGDEDGAASLAISLNDMLQFSIAFGLAMVWRKKPELHRRLILLASCALTVAAFARFPHAVVPPGKFYVAVDCLVGAAVLLDLFLTRRLHRVYLVGLPLMILGQIIALHLLRAPAWGAFANKLVGI